MYDYYFEKDVGLPYLFHTPLTGHRHDWENVVVLVREGEYKPELVATSERYGYSTRLAGETLDFMPEDQQYTLQFLDSHPKIVYHKCALSTHSLRVATPADDILGIENANKAWIRAALIDWEMWPSTELRDKMILAWNGTESTCKLSDDKFGVYLEMALGDHVSLIASMSCWTCVRENEG